jgi:hypothetical protein
MIPSPPPHQALREILQGMRPQRPLFMPIVFSLGARVERVPLRTFLYNPTKICNASLQISGYLPTDGVACYFDPTLEAEALGAELEWNSDSEPPAVRWPVPTGPDKSEPNLPQVAQVVQAGRIPLACEVIRRLNSPPTRNRLLMAGITGPFSLASRLMRSAAGLGQPDFASPVFEFAGSLIIEIATRYVEAGANMILVVEDALPPLSADQTELWASLLAPAFNIVRFYEALPVLLLTDHHSVVANRDSLFSGQWDCLLCPEVGGSRVGPASPTRRSGLGLVGMAAPLEMFTCRESDRENLMESIRNEASSVRPVVVTSAGDLPFAADMKHASKVLGELKQLVRW